MERILCLDPAKKQASWNDIKLKREELKRAPIATSKGDFDVDDSSFLNITNAINNFDAFKDEGSTTGKWKRYDNQWVDMSLADLKEIAEAVVSRAKVLHEKAEIINAGSFQVRELDDLTNWGID